MEYLEVMRSCSNNINSDRKNAILLNSAHEFYYSRECVLCTQITLLHSKFFFICVFLAIVFFLRFCPAQSRFSPLEEIMKASDINSRFHNSHCILSIFFKKKLYILELQKKVKITGYEMTVKRKIKYNEITLKYHLLLSLILIFYFLV